MIIYRFRITSEEHENFLREIDIQPKQTFFDFHLGIVEAAELLHCERASFFPTDKKYKKDKEITLKSEKRQVRKYDEDLDQVVTESLPLPMMKDSKVKDSIEDPHQRLIYEFHGRDHFTFFLELFRIIQVEGYDSYPKCVKSTGVLPKKAEVPAPAPDAAPLPKVVLPKVVMPKVEELAKFDDIVENDSELAEIEEQLDTMIEEDEAPEVFESAHQEQDPDDEYTMGGEEEEMEHIEDYDDLENLEKRFSGYGKDSDDY